MSVYSYEEAFNASVEYFDGDELAANVFVSKYALTDGSGGYFEITPTDMHNRLASEFARIEAKYPNPMSKDDIFDLLDHFRYVVPAGSPMSGIGNSQQVQSLGNCFVLEPPHDSYGGILKTDQELVQLMKRRGGVGFNISNIRPKGMPTKNAAKTTDGIAVFMERFSNSCLEVAQHGRRGAELQALSVHHPEIETFINIKRDETKVTGANISVLLTDEFMQAVVDDTEYEQRWPVNSQEPKISKMVSAKYIWNQIIDSAWYKAEPGLLFWDTVKRESPADVYAIIDPSFETTATNPCGEICMGVDSCRLTSINVKSFVSDPFLDAAHFDFDHFGDVAEKAQRLMDDLIDLEIEKIEGIIDKITNDPEPESVKTIELNLWKKLLENCKAGRRTGLGITGLGDALASLGVRYGSDESIRITKDIYKTLATRAYRSSCRMAGERGAFPIFDRVLESDHPFINRVLGADDVCKDLYEKYGRRNIALTTTPPAGSKSILAQCSSGIEPVFMLEYERWKKITTDDVAAKVDRVDDNGISWQKYMVYHHGFRQWMEKTGKKDVEDSPYYRSTALEINWTSAVRLQAVAQRWVCHSISRTTNIPKESPKELVADIYMAAWRQGCKGFTVYRDGCRDGVLTKKGEGNKEERIKQLEQRIKELEGQENAKSPPISHAPKRPEVLNSETHKIKVDFGDENDTPRNTYVTVSFFPGTRRPYEIFVQAPLSGLHEKDLQILELTARSTSMNLRHGLPIHYICEQLDKVGGQYIFSIPTNISRVLRKYVDNKEPETECTMEQYLEEVSRNQSESLVKCPHCNERTYRMKSSTCGECYSCGHEGCG